MKTLQQKANSIARKFGYGAATKIMRIPDNEPKIIEHVDYGYRKCSDGQYVPKAYLNNFGWKSCYYQHAETTVGVPESWKI